MRKCRHKILFYVTLIYTCVNIVKSRNILNSSTHFPGNNVLTSGIPLNLTNYTKYRPGFINKTTVLKDSFKPFRKNDRIPQRLHSLPKDFEITEVKLDRYRNIGIMAHIDAGKTTTTERILYLTGVTYKLGEVHDGEAVMDYMPQERERGITITSAATTCYWRGGYRKIPLHRINIIDTPGHVDFTLEVERSLRVLDGGIVVFDGVAGVETQSETVWRQADKFKVLTECTIPRIAYVNKMDRIGSDFNKCLEEMKEKLGAFPIPLFTPVGNYTDFQGVIDIIRGKFYKFKNEKMSFEYEELEIPDDQMDEYKKYRDLLMETVAQQSDELLEKYISEEPLTESEVRSTLRSLTLSNTVIPVACGSSLRNKNIQGNFIFFKTNLGILDMVLDFLPSPCETNKLFLDSIKSDEKKESEEETGKNEQETETDVNKYVNFDTSDFTLPLACLVFKLSFDAQVGNQSFVRIYRGSIKAGDYVYNPRTKRSQRVQKILFMHSNERKQIKEAHAGDIVSLVGVKAITGDTLCCEKNPIVLESIDFPEPVISLSVDIVNAEDDVRIQPVLSRYAEEDPSFRVHRNSETGETLISGMGELHLDVMVDRIRREQNLELKTGDPQVAFKETFVKEVVSEGKFIKQTGGKGQYGHVNLQVVPLEQGSGVQFESKITCGAIPKEFIPYVEEGIRDEFNTGLFANYPVTDVLVILTNGSFHEVDSSEFAFKMASSRGIKEAARLSGMKLLEPIMKVSIICPTVNFGEIISDLSKRRGRITKTKEGYGTVKEIEAEAPLKEMTGYMTKLRKMSQGRGFYTMEMSHYSPVPKEIQDQIIASKRKE
ncbi:translation elongation factor G (EF-G), putative [Theileria annulata]|uniref:Elongation factor G, mitochondrial n=1 Tax=Theileria annulata TaxID=5874 RepID=Q4UGL7_THEAN|nr:translation elongation factor G (EF-G), putative [Theileria annulata]CAI73772.1 translation elongation factor G (EF-G), putative [Theileria annulata]|eukprot:XP_954449.1 translation elongation factor G (EF-G), putative [Theileria annulata]